MRMLLYLEICFILTLTGCFGWGWGGDYENNITGNYYLSAIDAKENMCLTYSNDSINCVIIYETVFAVGFNKYYIIVKRHPHMGSEYEKKITNYFIVPIKIYNDKNYLSGQGVIGPLTKEEFEAKRIELNIPDSVTFTTVIKELE